MSDPVRTGHNAGPPLDEEEGPPWAGGDPYVYVCWQRAWRRAWKRIPHDVKIWRDDRAEALGLTYEEYTLELLERGRYLQAADTTRIAAIKRARFWR